MEATTHAPVRRTLAPRQWLMLLAGICLLAVGGWVYVSSRPGTLIYVLLHSPLGLTVCPWLPDFVRYCLPNGLWSLSSILMLHPLLGGVSSRTRVAIVSVVPALGVVSELMQGAGWLGGVFDPLDLVCYAAPWVVYLALTLRGRA